MNLLKYVDFKWPSIPVFDSPFLILHGLSGTGKSAMAKWFMCHSNWPVEAFIKADQWWDEFKGAAQNNKHKYLVVNAREYQRLVIDDLGSEPLAEEGGKANGYGTTYLASNELSNIIDCRYDARYRTIITTNLSPADLKKRYGDKIYRRIKQIGKFYEFTGDAKNGETKITDGKDDKGNIAWPAERTCKIPMTVAVEKKENKKFSSMEAELKHLCDLDKMTEKQRKIAGLYLNVMQEGKGNKSYGWVKKRVDELLGRGNEHVRAQEKTEAVRRNAEKQTPEFSGQNDVVGGNSSGGVPGLSQRDDIQGEQGSGEGVGGGNSNEVKPGVPDWSNGG